MMTTADLDLYITTATHDYISKGIKLNDSITKLASDHGLNREQINRVVEGANTQTYVQLFNQSKDKYIQFDNADSEKIASVALTDAPKTAEVTTTDYETSPDAVLHEKIGTVFNTPAEEPHSTVGDDLNTYYKLSALQTQLENTMVEVDMKFQHEADVMYSMVKQAVLEGTPFGDVYKAVTSVYPDPVVNASFIDIGNRLTQEMPTRNFEKTSSVIGSVNKDNTIVKQAELLTKYAQEYFTLRDKTKEATANLINHVKEAGAFKNLRASFKKTPKTLALAGGLGFVAGSTLTKHIDETEQRNANSPLSSIPAQYQR